LNAPAKFSCRVFCGWNREKVIKLTSYKELSIAKSGTVARQNPDEETLAA